MLTQYISSRSQVFFKKNQQNLQENSRDGILFIVTAQKMKFSIKDFYSKCDQIRNFLQIWSHLLKKSLMENFTFYAVSKVTEPAYNYRRSQAHFQVFSCRSLEILQSSYPANIYLFKVNNRNTRKRCEVSSKLIIKAPERRR